MPERTTDAAVSEPDTITPEAEDAATAPKTAQVPPSPAPETEDPETEDPETEDRHDAPPSPPGRMPEYKGEPLDAERGPGLGCFWIQIALLTFFLVFTPLTVTWGWDPTISGILLIITLILLLFSGQTIIFLLRLVAADRRARRTPLSPSAKPTVGQMEDAGSVTAPQDETAGPVPSATDAPEAAADDRPDHERPSDG